MNEPEIKDAETVEEAPARLALPPPPARDQAYAAARAGILDRLIVAIETRPWAASFAIFALLLVLHLGALNLAGVASGIFVGDALFFATGPGSVEVVLLAFIAYNVVLPTLFAQACIGAYDALRPALQAEEHQIASARGRLLDPFYGVRLGAGLLWAVLLTPVFGTLLRETVPGEGAGAAILTLWLYIRIALTFGLLGASIGFIVMLHHRFRGATGSHLRIDLFDLAPLRPIAAYARTVALYLVILLALAGPAVSQPDAMYASSAILILGVLLTAVAVAGAMWGARRAIRAAKRTALTELQAYSRELWRRAYANNKVAEAVAIPALGAMLTVRNEIARIPDWPGGWGVFARLATLAAIPVASWFGGQFAAQLMAAFTP